MTFILKKAVTISTGTKNWKGLPPCPYLFPLIFFYIIMEFISITCYGGAQNLAKNMGLTCEGVDPWTDGDMEHLVNLKPGGRARLRQSVFALLEPTMVECMPGSSKYSYLSFG